MKRKFESPLLGTALFGAASLFASVACADNSDGVFRNTERPSLSFYGLPGLIDMPSAEMLPDGQLAISVSNFATTTRTTLAFQATPRIQAGFRYTGIDDAGFTETYGAYRDRSFDVRFLLNRESRYLPALTIGLQDLAGTGLYSGEFVVATKNFSGGAIPGTLKATAGLGWGRLGSSGSIGTPFGSNREGFRSGESGGELSAGTWFRGDVAPFGGLEWQVDDKWGLKAEYSSDDYGNETRGGIFERKSRFNFGVEYQVNDAVRLGGYYLYGSEVGLNLQIQLNPEKAVAPVRISAPLPYYIRPDRAKRPDAYNTDWAPSEKAGAVLIRDALVPLLEKEGLTLIEVKTNTTTTEVRYANDTYGATTVSIGRVARVLARLLPDSVETFRIVPVVGGLAQSVVVLRRADLERLEFAPDASEALLASAQITDAAPFLSESARNEELYPSFNWSFSPFLRQRVFDPDDPLQVDVGVQLNLSYQPAPGWTVAGQLQQTLIQGIEEGDGVNDSVLQHVRTDGDLYARGGRTSVSNLYVNRQWKVTPDVYARFTAGYLERMFGGVSAEVLWKPVASRLAFGVEANYVKQRAFEDLLGFQDYSVVTGHASAYYEFGNGYLGKLDVGRYLAGDVGGTVTLEREFANGWRVGGYFTLTDVSAADFGEGSFDKGIKVTVPVSWLIGKPRKQELSRTLQPLTRDGGARLSVPGRLYEQVRSGHAQKLVGNWSGVWE